MLARWKRVGNVITGFDAHANVQRGQALHWSHLDNFGAIRSAQSALLDAHAPGWIVERKKVLDEEAEGEIAIDVRQIAGRVVIAARDVDVAQIDCANAQTSEYRLVEPRSGVPITRIFRRPKAAGPSAGVDGEPEGPFIVFTAGPA